MKKQQIELNGHKVWVTSHWMQDQLWIHFNGQIIKISDPNFQSRAQKNKSQLSQHPDKVLSPMPGRITKINTQVGETVVVGQALIMMEAMKMEYTLKAERAGEVSAINVQIGDQVTLGQLLIKLQLGEDESHA